MTGDRSTLPQAARAFAGYSTPRIIGPFAVVAWVARIVAGRWSLADLVIPGAIVALEPFTEWTIHVVLLHWEPREIRGRLVDPFVARKHRAHHRDPRDIPLVFIPVHVLVISLVTAAVAWFTLAFTIRHALIGLAASYTMLFVYEWTHYLIHTTYRPRRRLYRSVWRAHRLHHYRNENYWFGVTMHGADHVLRTFPPKEAVPVSPTARTLGVDEGAAERQR